MDKTKKEKAEKKVVEEKELTRERERGIVRLLGSGREREEE